ncbi:uncharacterized protein LOC129597823 isoform X2 [Paramacrobiotus metropolitanus]|nr:uncharacterized protein LOC129597823 isoform X2 [Paramacrobiotus metropolitanus]XP_055351487.1 uncharacterized protein LOC129597823 isoform X2 [Paramacrobiotus metropolitanus]
MMLGNALNRERSAPPDLVQHGLQDCRGRFCQFLSARLLHKRFDNVMLPPRRAQTVLGNRRRWRLAKPLPATSVAPPPSVSPLLSSDFYPHRPAGMNLFSLFNLPVHNYEAHKWEAPPDRTPIMPAWAALLLDLFSGAHPD